MIVDFFDSLARFFAVFHIIWGYFGTIRQTLEDIIVQIQGYDFLGPVTPYLGAIRYVIGDTVYMILAVSLQIGLFLLLTKTMYRLVYIVLNSFLVQKPLSIIKTFMGL